MNTESTTVHATASLSVTARDRDPYLRIEDHARRMTIDTLLAIHGRTLSNATKFHAMTTEELSSEHDKIFAE